MKKFLALLLAVLMVASMSVTAFAVGSSDIDADTAKSVTGDGTVTVNSTNNTTEDQIIYYVEISWKDLDFTYTINDGTNAVWDPEEHQYEVDNVAVTGSWTNGDANGATISDALTVTNHSNTDVEVAVSFKDNKDEENEVKASFERQSAYADNVLNNGELYTAANADKIVYDVSVTGTPNVLNEFDVGTINVTFSKYTPPVSNG